jgi:hypothetical protein
MEWVPVDACALPTAEQPLRVREFEELFARALLAVDRPAPGQAVLALAGDSDLPTQVQELADRESSCCSFFTFTVSGAADQLRLGIEVPATRADVLDGLVAQAERALVTRNGYSQV